MNVGQYIRYFFRAYFILAVLLFSILGAIEFFLPEWFAAIMGGVFKGGKWWQEQSPGFWGYVGTIFQAAVIVFIWPVMKAQVLIERQIGWSFSPQEYGDYVLGVYMFSVLFASWAFWSTLYVRGLRLAGLWNPFWNVWERKRGLILRGWLRFRDWWEMSQQFGKGPIAKWASLPEVMSHRFCEGDIFLGRPKLFVGGMMRPVGIASEKHMVTIAGTGSGKSTAALIPNLCIHEGSLLCIDPKGELARITADRRGDGRQCKGMGQRVYVLDPFGIVDEGRDESVPASPFGEFDARVCYQAAYNPFDEIARVSERDPDRAVSYAAKIAEALVRPMSQNETYWDNAAKTFIRGLILYIFVHDEKKDLVRLRQLIMEGDVEGWGAAVNERVIDGERTTPFDYLLERMRFVRDGQHGEVIAASAGMVSMMGDNQRGSVITTAQEHTAFLDLPEIRRVSERSDFLLENLKRDLVSVYVCVPINMVAGPVGRWLRMFVLLFIDMMMRVQEAPKPPVLLAIDEFPSLGKLDGIETVAPVLRSYGVRFWAVGQDIAQFMHVYPDAWTGFIGGAEAVQFMGLIHPATVDFMVERLGEHEVMRDGRSVGARPLLDRDQIGRFLAKTHKNQIIWFGSKRPMKLKLCPYYEYLPWWYYSPDVRFRESLNRAIWRFIKRGWSERLYRWLKPFADWFVSDPRRVERLEMVGEAGEDVALGWLDFIAWFKPATWVRWWKYGRRRRRRG